MPLRSRSGKVSTNSLCSVKGQFFDPSGAHWAWDGKKDQQDEAGGRKAHRGVRSICYGEFDPGSERTLAAWIRHASRARIWEFKFSDEDFRRKAAEG